MAKTKSAFIPYVLAAATAFSTAVQGIESYAMQSKLPDRETMDENTAMVAKYVIPSMWTATGINGTASLAFLVAGIGRRRERKGAIAERAVEPK